jgi:hypothetical protein
VFVHGNALKFLRAEHRHEEIDEQREGYDADDDEFHGCLLEDRAPADVERARGEERQQGSDINQIIHSQSPAVSDRVLFAETMAQRGARALIKTGARGVKISLRGAAALGEWGALRSILDFVHVFRGMVHWDRR